MLQEHQTALDPLSYLKNSFHSELQRVDKMIFESVSTDEPLIEKVATTLISAGGKRLRPLLCLASSHIANKITENTYYLSAAIELIHVATLLHDDVIDESILRRGKQTSNTIWGNKPSILVGDFLFARAFELMVNTGNIRFLGILAKASSQISKGEIAQLRHVKSLDLGIQDYLKIIEYKTATLFAASCQTGAFSGGANENVAGQLYEFGKNFGLMYQIIDDVLDYTDDTRGKTIGDDFYERKVTFPVLLAYQKDTNKFFWHQCFKDSKTEEVAFENVRNRLQAFDAFNQSITFAKQYAQKAKASLHAFNSETAKLLDSFVESFFKKVTRQY